MIVTIILFLVILGILVISHEFGHYIVGRLNGVRVNEFTVGFGPKLLSFRRGETLFALRLLPFGGACIFDGAEPELDEEGGKELDEHALPNVSAVKRAATLAAGPFANFVLAFLFALIIVGFSGADLPVINMIMEDSAAEECGMQAGDIIRKIDGEHIHLYREVSMISAMNMDGSSLDIEYERDGQRYTVTLTPKYSEADARYYIGFRGAGEYIECNPLQIFQYGFYEVEYWARYTVKSLGMLINRKVGMDALSGPVGMAEVVGDTYEEVKPYGISSVILTMMNLMVLLSVNLGILNLLPLPALDGGRLVFALFEMITGRKVPPKYEGIVHLIGVVFFLLLMIVIMYHDIMRLFA